MRAGGALVEAILVVLVLVLFGFAVGWTTHCP